MIPSLSVLAKTGEPAVDYEEGGHPDAQPQTLVEIQEEEGLSGLPGRHRTAGQGGGGGGGGGGRLPRFRVGGQLGRRTRRLHVALRLQRPDAPGPQRLHDRTGRFPHLAARLHAPSDVVHERTGRTRIQRLGPRPRLHIRTRRLQLHGTPRTRFYTTHFC